MAGAGDSRSRRWRASASCAKRAAVGAPGEVARRPWRRRGRGPRRRAGPRSRGGSACRSYEVVDPGGSGGSPSIVGRSGRADAAVPRRTRRRPHRAPARGARRARPTCGASPATSWVRTRPTTSPRTRSSARGGRCRRSGATRAPAPGCSRSPAGPAPTRCGATCAGGGSPSGPSSAARAARTRHDRRPERRARGRGAGRRAPARPARRVRAHPDGRVLLRGGGRGLRRPGRAPSGRGSPGPASTWSRRCARVGDRMTVAGARGCARSRVVGAVVGGSCVVDRGARGRPRRRRPEADELRDRRCSG